MSEYGADEDSPKDDNEEELDDLDEYDFIPTEKSTEGKEEIFILNEMDSKNTNNSQKTEEKTPEIELFEGLFELLSNKNMSYTEFGNRIGYNVNACLREKQQPLHRTLIKIRKRMKINLKGKNIKELDQIIDSYRKKRNLQDLPKEGWSFLDKDHKGNQLTKIEQIKAAADYYKEIIIPNLLKKKKINRDKPPSSYFLVKTEYKSFISAISQRGIQFSDVFKVAGFKNRKDWTFLYEDDKSNPLSKKEKLKNAIDYFESIILPKLIDKNIIKEDQHPTREDLKKGGYGGFYYALRRGKHKISYINFINATNFEIIEREDWSFLDLKKYKERVKAATRYLKEKIIPELVKSGLYNKGDMPTENLLRDNGYSGYISALLRKSRRIKFTDILRELGYTIPDNRDWMFLHNDSNGKTLEYEEVLKKASTYFKNVLLKDLIKQNIIRTGQIPTVSLLKETNYYGFLSTLENKGINYCKLLIASDLDCDNQTKLKIIGNAFHWVIEKIIMDFYEKKGIKSFYEVRTASRNSSYSKNRCDISIIINKNFTETHKKLQNLFKKYDRIELVNIDFTMGQDEKLLRKKGLKGYQGQKKVLFIITLFGKQNYETPKDIPFSKNVKIMHINKFMKLFNIKQNDIDTYKKMKSAIALTQFSTHDDDKMEKLIRVSQIRKTELKIDFNSNQEDFVEFLIRNKKSYLLA